MNDDVTRILSQIEVGDGQAAERLLPLVYDELRRLAAQRLQHELRPEAPQTTSLVHAAYLRLVDVSCAPHWNGRRHFFAAAAEAMRRILVERARQRRRVKHGGHLKRVGLDEPPASDARSADEILAVHEALRDLEEESPDKAALVKLRYFAGMTLQEAADALGISHGTAKNYWSYAKAFLFCALHEPNSFEKSLP